MIEYVQPRSMDTERSFVAWIVDESDINDGDLRDGWWLSYHQDQDKSGFTYGTIMFYVHDFDTRMVLTGGSKQIRIDASGHPFVDGISMADQLVLEAMLKRAKRVASKSSLRQKLRGPRKVRP